MNTAGCKNRPLLMSSWSY